MFSTVPFVLNQCVGFTMSRVLTFVSFICQKRKTSKSSESSSTPNKLRKQPSHEKETAPKHARRPSRSETEALTEVYTPPSPPVPANTAYPQNYGVHGIPNPDRIRDAT